MIWRKSALLFATGRKRFPNAIKSRKQCNLVIKKKRVIFTEIELETARLAEKAQIRFLR